MHGDASNAVVQHCNDRTKKSGYVCHPCSADTPQQLNPTVCTQKVYWRVLQLVLLQQAKDPRSKSAELAECHWHSTATVSSVSRWH